MQLIFVAFKSECIFFHFIALLILCLCSVSIDLALKRVCFALHSMSFYLSVGGYT